MTDELAIFRDDAKDEEGKASDTGKGECTVVEEHWFCLGMDAFVDL